MSRCRAGLGPHRTLIGGSVDCVPLQHHDGGGPDPHTLAAAPYAGRIASPALSRQPEDSPMTTFQGGRPGLAAAVALCLLLAGCSGGAGGHSAPSTSPGVTSPPAASTGMATRQGAGRICGRAAKPPATWAHVIWIWMENHDYTSVVGNPRAPYENNALIGGCGLATNYHNITHPSLPNYLAATSGHPQVDSDSRRVPARPPRRACSTSSARPARPGAPTRSRCPPTAPRTTPAPMRPGTIRPSTTDRSPATAPDGTSRWARPPAGTSSATCAPATCPTSRSSPPTCATTPATAPTTPARQAATSPPSSSPPRPTPRPARTRCSTTTACSRRPSSCSACQPRSASLPTPPPPACEPPSTSDPQHWATNTGSRRSCDQLPPSHRDRAAPRHHRAVPRLQPGPLGAAARAARLAPGGRKPVRPGILLPGVPGRPARRHRPGAAVVLPRPVGPDPSRAAPLAAASTHPDARRAAR